MRIISGSFKGKKILQPKGIAEGILFLLSDQSEYITGTELIIDGGLTARP